MKDLPIENGIHNTNKNTKCYAKQPSTKSSIGSSIKS